MKPKVTIILALPLLAGVIMGLGLSNSALGQQQVPNNHHEQIQLAASMLEELSQAPDPETAFEQLSEEDRRIIEDNLFVHSLTTNVGPAVNVETGATLSNIQSSELSSLEAGQAVPYAGFAGCWTREAVGNGVNAYGVIGVLFGQTTEVCVINNRVRSVKVSDTWSQTYLPGWSVRKNPETSTKNVRWEGRGRAQFHFVLGSGGWDVRNFSPCLQARLNRDGVHYALSYSCNLSGPM